MGADGWVIQSDIEARIKAKIEAVGTPLKDWDIQINYGIKTGLNDAFIISKDKRDELIAEDPRSAEIIRPILRGKDIERYKYNFADKWIILTHNGNKDKNIDPINMEHYPAITNHLSKYYDQLQKRDDKGITPYHLRSCGYLEEFTKQKLVWTPVNSEYRFALIPPDYYMNNSLFMITGDSIIYLCAILNSDLMQKYFQINLSGDHYAYGSGSFFSRIPILLPDKNTLNSIISLTNQIIETTTYDEKSSIAKQEINTLINSLYNLSKEEIIFIKH